MSKITNREIAERLVDKLRPRLVGLIAELLDEERGGGADDEQQPARIPGISQANYERAAAMAARWRSGGGKKRKAG